jgi:hypothetical protein
MEHRPLWPTQAHDRHGGERRRGQLLENAVMAAKGKKDTWVSPWPDCHFGGMEASAIHAKVLKLCVLLMTLAYCNFYMYSEMSI